MAADLKWPRLQAPAAARSAKPRPAILLLGPGLGALSGVSSHLRMLLASPLSRRFALLHFQVGSEGRSEGRLARLVRLLAAPWALLWAVRSHRVPVVHINTSLNPRAFWRDLLNLAVARACGARVLLQVHGGALPQEFFGHSRALTALLRGALRQAHAVVVLARCELNAYRAFVPAHRVVLIPNAVVCPAHRPTALDRWPQARSLRLVYIGRLVKEKGLFELLQGLQMANACGANHKMTLAGLGPDEPALKRRAQELGLAAQVEFVGAVHEAGRARLLADADVFVLPSYSEGLPYALLEAMAAGLPVIATRVGAIADLVEDRVHGRLIAPGDAPAIAGAIGELSRRSHQLTRMGVACRDRVARTCSIERLADGFARLYTELLPGGRGSGSGVC